MSLVASRDASAKQADRTSNPTTRAPSQLRIAIVGCGPRGLQCLDSLSRRLANSQSSQLKITAYESTGIFGAGQVYDPGQPQCLRMNYAADQIDFWNANRAGGSRDEPSLLEWLNAHYPSMATLDSYVPRAIVGEYLQECFQGVSNRLSRSAEFVSRKDRVQSIERRESSWLLNAHDDSQTFDQVVVTTGHECWRPSDVLGTHEDARFVFPVEQQLSEDAVPPGATVLLRGFGLTALDAILALTEHRGGQFVESRLLPKYKSSQAEPSRIDVVSRTGRPMLAKPLAQVVRPDVNFWIPYRDQLKERLPRHGCLRFRTDLWLPVLRAAAAWLSRCRQESFEARHVEDWFRTWRHYTMDASAAQKYLLQSYAVAIGQRKVDAASALGEAWRRLYPEIVELVSFGGLADGEWESFRRVAIEMERVAFGPPAESVGKLLSLVRSGVVRLLSPVESSPVCDTTVHAVIAGPHEARRHEIVSSAARNGFLSIDPPTNAVKVDRAGFTRDATFGLALFGRATEGWILGNDTLSRTLHGQIDEWAAQVARIVEGRRQRKGWQVRA